MSRVRNSVVGSYENLSRAAGFVEPRNGVASGAAGGARGTGEDEVIAAQTSH